MLKRVLIACLVVAFVFQAFGCVGYSTLGSLTSVSWYRKSDVELYLIANGINKDVRIKAIIMRADEIARGHDYEIAFKEEVVKSNGEGNVVIPIAQGGFIPIPRADTQTEVTVAHYKQLEGEINYKQLYRELGNKVRAR